MTTVTPDEPPWLLGTSASEDPRAIRRDVIERLEPSAMVALDTIATEVIGELLASAEPGDPATRLSDDEVRQVVADAVATRIRAVHQAERRLKAAERDIDRLERELQAARRSGAATDSKARVTGSATSSDTSGTISAAALMSKRFQRQRFAIQGMVPEGLVILASHPKVGKSWMLLSWGIAVAAGGKALGLLDVDEGDVLYLALEDTERRLQGRLATILDDPDMAPRGLELKTSMSRLNEGGLQELRTWLAEHPDARLVMIDTLAKVKPRGRGDTNLYELDYEAIAQLKAVADEFRIAIVVAHHLRKSGRGDAKLDPLELVSGTMGLTGAADAVLVIDRKRGKAEAKLHVTGRDVLEAEHELTWSQGAGTWAIVDPKFANLSDERREVLEYLQAADGPRTPTMVATVLGKERGSIGRLMWEMRNDGQLAGGGRAGYAAAANDSLGRAKRIEDRILPRSSVASLDSQDSVTAPEASVSSLVEANPDDAAEASGHARLYPPESSESWPLDSLDSGRDARAADDVDRLAPEPEMPFGVDLVEPSAGTLVH